MSQRELADRAAILQRQITGLQAETLRLGSDLVEARKMLADKVEEINGLKYVRESVSPNGALQLNLGQLRESVESLSNTFPKLVDQSDRLQGLEGRVQELEQAIGVCLSVSQANNRMLTERAAAEAEIRGLEKEALTEWTRRMKEFDTGGRRLNEL